MWKKKNSNNGKKIVTIKLDLKSENLKIGTLAVGTLTKKKCDGQMIYGLVLFF